MKRERDLLDKFEHLPSIEPSADWNRELMSRIDQSGASVHDHSVRKLVLFAILILLAVNIFSLSKSWLNERSLQNNDNLKEIAAEYMITTNSSKF